MMSIGCFISDFSLKLFMLVLFVSTNLDFAARVSAKPEIDADDEAAAAAAAAASSSAVVEGGSCRQADVPVDAVFAVDTSNSVNWADFTLEMQFVARFVRFLGKVQD